MRIRSLHLAAFLLAGCLTDARGEQHIDLFRVHQGLQLMEGRLGDGATVYDGVDDGLAKNMRRWAQIVDEVDVQVEGVLAGGDRVPDWDLVLAELDAIAQGLLSYVNDDPRKQADVRGWGLLVSTGLDLVKLGLEKPPPIPQP